MFLVLQIYYTLQQFPSAGEVHDSMRGDRFLRETGDQNSKKMLDWVSKTPSDGIKQSVSLPVVSASSVMSCTFAVDMTTGDFVSAPFETFSTRIKVLQ